MILETLLFFKNKNAKEKSENFDESLSQTNLHI